MKQLRIGVLAGLFVVAGVLSWAAARLWDAFGTLPSVPLAAPIVLAAIAAVLAATALSRGGARPRPPAGPAPPPQFGGPPPSTAGPPPRPGAQGVDPLMAARAVVFGQASALVAALVSGMYGGTGVFLLGSLDIPARRDQAIYAGFSVLAGIAVIVAAFFLERVCKLPEDGDDPKNGAAPAGPAA
ncbi:DUF3180 domain-containing protein [Streptomyces sp. NPDC059142]|uniref:DUF3180 domain-containing protein n=1 Tax=Streptomyces sp. NPDC059142 TaxID=3346739 RepID=UPI0036A6EEDD